MFHQNRASERLQRDEKIGKRMRSADKMVKSQGLWNADSGRRHLILDFLFIYSPTFVHLSQFTFNFFFKVLLINTTVHMIFLNLIDLQHQGINLVPFIMLPGNWSELNLVYWNEREKGLQIKTKNKNPVNCHYWCRTLCGASGI